jgi:lysophospholipase L1-like esterase
VAIGDSFTEGVGDEDAAGVPRGWADRVAAGLAGASGEPVHYANLAVRGRLLADVVGPQLDAALALDPAPTLITLNGGGNDMLRPRTDVAGLAALTARAVDRCAAAGVRLVLLSGADPSDRLPLGRVVHRRGAELSATVRTLAAAHGLTFVDVFGDAEIRRPGYWSDDRLHLGTPAPGHARAPARRRAGAGGTRGARRDARDDRRHDLADRAGRGARLLPRPRPALGRTTPPGPVLRRRPPGEGPGLDGRPGTLSCADP